MCSQRLFFNKRHLYLQTTILYIICHIHFDDFVEILLHFDLERSYLSISIPISHNVYALIQHYKAT